MKKPAFPSFFNRIPRRTLILLLLFIVPALAYLLLAGKLGLYADDWYLMYAGRTQGVQKFWDIFIIDRPLRAFLVGGFYLLFGARAPLYTISAYLFRVAGGLALLWSLRLLWPRQRLVTLVMALLFILYPGFMDQTNAIDYQSHLASLCFALLSIALSLKAVNTRVRWQAAGLWLVSTLLALLYLGLMEYFIGLEAFRFLAIAILYLRGRARLTHKLRAALLGWLPYAAAPLLFLLWRLVFFQNQRGATDISSMASAFSGSPLVRGLWMVVYLFQDLLNTILFAWVVPIYQTVFRLRLREALLAFAVGLLAAVVTLALLGLLRRQSTPETGSDSVWRAEAIFLGLASCALALVPVVFGSRHIVFPTYSRFTLTASVGAVIAIVAFLSSLNSVRYRSTLIFLAVLLAVMFHYGNAVKAADETASIRAFWWQAVWRIPNIQPGTTLLANYPDVAIPEDYYVWSPANLIYYSEKKADDRTPLSLSAIVLNQDTLMNILGQGPAQTVDRRGLISTRDFGNLLVLTRPSSGSCMQALDGSNAELSTSEAQDMMLAAPYSNIKNLLTSGQPLNPPGEIFGAEPPHGWCYYYEKAALARQRGDWAEAGRLGDEAIAQKLHPADWVEWLPILQAYAHLDRDEAIRALAPVINEQLYLRRQVCDGVKSGSLYYRGLSASMQTGLSALFCK